MVKIKRNKLVSIFDRQVIRGTVYKLGAKARVGSKPENIASIDCSGEVRYLLYQATDGKLLIPDGSWNQREWCEKQKLREVKYTDLPKADPSRLFIAFITANVNGAGSIGHVWLVSKLNKDSIPDTMESYGGHGVGSRRWDHPTLRRLVHKVFELPTE